MFKINFKYVLYLLLGITAAVLTVFYLKQQQPKNVVPPIVWNLNSNQQLAQAAEHARKINGVFYTSNGKSMQPIIVAGDILVVDNNIPYESIKEGRIVVYQARWAPRDAYPTAHWAVVKQGKEWIMSGENNPIYERGPNMGMGINEYNATGKLGQKIGGEVVAIYTQRKQPVK